MYCDDGCLCVCLSVCVPPRIPTLLHRPGCNFGEWWGVSPSCALLSGLQMQSAHGFRCHGNIRAWCEMSARTDVLAVGLWLVLFNSYATSLRVKVSQYSFERVYANKTPCVGRLTILWSVKHRAQPQRVQISKCFLYNSYLLWCFMFLPSRPQR